MKKKTLSTSAAAGAFAMALTLLPAGSAQAASTYLPTKQVVYTQKDGKWVKNNSIKTSYNKKGAAIKTVSTFYQDNTVYTTKRSYKGSNWTGEKCYSGNILTYKTSISYKKGLPRVMKTAYYNGLSNPGKTVFKYKGKLPVTISLYMKGKKFGYWKNTFKKGRLISHAYYSADGEINQTETYSYKNGDLVKSSTYTYIGGKKELSGASKYTYKKHRLVKSVKKAGSEVTNTTYNKKGLPVKETYKSSASSRQTTYSYKYYKNKAVKEILCQTKYDFGDETRSYKSKNVYSGFKKFKSTPTPGIIEKYLTDVGQ